MLLLLGAEFSPASGRLGLMPGPGAFAVRSLWLRAQRRTLAVRSLWLRAQRRTRLPPSPHALTSSSSRCPRPSVYMLRLACWARVYLPTPHLVMRGALQSGLKNFSRECVEGWGRPKINYGKYSRCKVFWHGRHHVSVGRLTRSCVLDLTERSIVTLHLQLLYIRVVGHVQLVSCTCYCTQR
jgi:hypothetical protein